MAKYFLMFCGLFLIITGKAQNTIVPENKSQTLQERYSLMKTNSETYQDYKVIKEYLLDGVWKIATDSMNKRDEQLTRTLIKMDSLENRLNRAQTELKTKSDSMSDIVFESDHIKFLGKNFSKSTFMILFFITILLFVLIISMLVMRLINMQKLVKESHLTATNITHELEEYKHKALEKQTKLARELQTERNKLSELLEKNRR